MMTPSPLLVSTQDKITTLTLNRPEKCNALDGALIQHLQEAFVRAQSDAKTELVLLRGKGEHFCAGADIDWMEKLAAATFEQGRDDARSLASLLYLMRHYPKPILTLAQGSIRGGGLGLLACSDMVLASQESNFCFSEVKLGLVPAVISPYLISAIGEQAARYYFLTAETFKAEEAYRLGLVHQLVPSANLEQAGASLLETLKKHSPAALAEVKHLFALVVGQEITLELAEKTAELFAKLRVSKQGREGLKAFLEKRQPSWS